MTGPVAEHPGDPATARAPFAPGFVAGSLHDLRSLRLAGVRCLGCGTTLLGLRRRCENCTSRELVEERFEGRGVIHSWTVQRYPPPAPFAVPGSWAPRALAWVDLDGGPRVLGPLRGDPAVARIGLAVRVIFDVGWIDDAGREVIAFAFEPEGAGVVA